MANTIWSNFTANTAPALTDFVVGYNSTSSGGEKRWQMANVRTLMQANLGTAAFTNSTAYDVNGAAAAITKASVGLGNVENTALSTWNGSANLSTVGLVNVGAWQANVINTAYGGTNISTYATGDLLYASGTNVLARLADVGTGNVLLSGGAGVAPTYGKVNIVTAIVSNIAIANIAGGIGATASTFLRGDNTWATPGGSGNVVATTGNVAANFVVIGDGTTAIKTVNTQGTTSTVLHGNATGAPFFASVSLTADIAGTLPVANGGTNLTSYNIGDLVYASGATTLAKLANVAPNAVLVSGNTPAWASAINLAAAQVGAIGNAVPGTANFTSVTVGSTAGSTGLTNAPTAGAKLYFSPFTNGTTTTITLPAGSGGTNLTLFAIASNGTSTFTTSANVKRFGDPDTNVTVITPTPPGNHRIYFEMVNAVWYYSDTIFSNNVVNGATGANSFTAFSVVTGGATSTSPLQSIANLGTSGHVLTSTGSGSAPTFQAVPASGGGAAVVGTPTANQIAQWTNSSAIQGINTVPVAQGGTNINTYVTGDILHASATNVIGRIADVTVGAVLVSGGVGAVPVWSANPMVTGSFIINAAANVLTAGPTGTIWQLGGPSGTTAGTIDAFAGTAALFLRRANGTSGARTNVATNDLIGGMFGVGYGATGYASSGRASVRLYAAENWTDTAQGAYVQIFTSAPGTTGPNVVATFTASGANVAGFGNYTGILSSPNVFAHGLEVTNEIPIVPKNANYTTTLLDSGKGIYHANGNATAYVQTIDSFANVAWTNGTTFTYFNDSGAGNYTINVAGGDTLMLAGAGTLGARTLAANGVATATMIAPRRWLINGTGLT